MRVPPFVGGRPPCRGRRRSSPGRSLAVPPRAPAVRPEPAADGAAAPSGTSRRRDHSRWNSTGRTCSRSPTRSAPVSGQPADVRHEHRLGRIRPLERPAHRPASLLGCLEGFFPPLVQAVDGPDIDHPGPAVGEPYEVVRGVTTRFPPVVSVQPERLRSDRPPPDRDPAGPADPVPAMTRIPHGQPSSRRSTGPESSRRPSPTGTGELARVLEANTPSLSKRQPTATCDTVKLQLEGR